MPARALCIALRSTAALALSGSVAFSASIGYFQTNLVSDIPGLAVNTDRNLQNPWGISFSPSGSPFWVSDNGTGLTTLYNSSGTPQSLVVTIPAPGGGTSAPTGQVFNGTSAFDGDLFLFASEDGAITGWKGSLGTTAEILFDSSGAGAIYKGLAIGTVGPTQYIYAADFHNGVINVFDSSGPATLAGNFVDPNLPAGYAPFNVENIGNELYVTYAKQLAGSDDEQDGPGLGIVDIFRLDGTLDRRLVTNGPLNAPWGIAKAPENWGALGGTLLIGNFGDGTINAFDLSTGAFAGAVSNGQGMPLTNDGLWGLTFGNGGNGGNANSLYLTAGLNGEANGLFAQIDPVPEPGTAALVAGGVFALILRARRRTIER
jgi:uncharacterized protein (TIGR03118 family)